MARCALYGCLIVVAVSSVIRTSNGDKDFITQKPIDVEEKVLKFTLRTFTNPLGKWITQVEMQRHGFPKEGAVPRVQFSVEQNRSESNHPPHLVARLAAASGLDGEIEEVESEGFDLQTRPRFGWMSSNMMCKISGLRLAVPSPEAFEWLNNTLSNIDEEVSEVYVGISNIVHKDDSFQTVLGQPVMNGTQLLQDTNNVLCGVLNTSRVPYTLSFDDCLVPRPFLCEVPQDALPLELDVSPWLSGNTLSSV